MTEPAHLPDDIDALKAIILTQRDQNARLEALVKAFKKAPFGAKSERIDPDQYELTLEDIETGIAQVQAEIDADERTAPVRAPKECKPRGVLPKHLPRVEVIVEPDSTTCSCGHERHVIHCPAGDLQSKSAERGRRCQRTVGHRACAVPSYCHPTSTLCLSRM